MFLLCLNLNLLRLKRGVGWFSGAGLKNSGNFMSFYFMDLRIVAFIARTCVCLLLYGKLDFKFADLLSTRRLSLWFWCGCYIILYAFLLLFIFIIINFYPSRESRILPIFVIIDQNFDRGIQSECSCRYLSAWKRF